MNLSEFLKLEKYENGCNDGLYFWDNITSLHIPKGNYVQGDLRDDLDIKYDLPLDMSPNSQYLRAKDSGLNKAFCGFVCQCINGLSNMTTVKIISD